MKRLYFRLLAAVAVGVMMVAIGCNKVEKYPDRIVGEWDFEGYRVENGGKYEPEDVKYGFTALMINCPNVDNVDLNLTFSEQGMAYDNKCSGERAAGIKYTFVGESLKVVYDDGTIETFMVTKLNNSKLTLQIYRMGNLFEYEFDKK